MQRPVIEFWYEFASTYSYPAAMRVAQVASARGIDVAWQPFLLGPIFGALGWKTSPFNLQPAKGAYMWRDVTRICAALDIPFVRPEPFPQNGLVAARIAMAVDSDTRAAFSRAVYRAQFAEGATISDPATLERVLADLDLDPQSVTARATSDATKQALRDNTDRAQHYGIFGAPTWRTPDGEIFWGNDRLEDALDWATGINPR